MLEKQEGGIDGSNYRNSDLLRGDGRSSGVAAEPAGEPEGSAGGSGADGVSERVEGKA